MPIKRVCLNEQWQLIGPTPMEIEALNTYPALVTVASDMPDDTPDTPIMRVLGSSGNARVFDTPNMNVYARSSHVGHAVITATPRADISRIIAALQGQFLSVDPETLDVIMNMEGKSNG